MSAETEVRCERCGGLARRQLMGTWICDACKCGVMPPAPPLTSNPKSLLRDIYVTLADAKTAREAMLRNDEGAAVIHSFFQLFGPRIREALGCEDFAAVRAWQPDETKSEPIIDWKSSYEEAIRQRDALQTDANRYRWLRDYTFVEAYYIDGAGGVDSAIRVQGSVHFLDEAVDMERIKDVRPAVKTEPSQP